MTTYQEAEQSLLSNQKTWLITGVAGFIGSNLLERLLNLNQVVVGIDNFSTGHEKNLEQVQNSIIDSSNWRNFTFFNGNIASLNDCKRACEGIDHVLHQAALGSVPRSLNDPLASNKVNIEGFLNMLISAKDANVLSFTYAASSSTYGDHTALPKREDVIGNPLSPYAVTKFVNELYAEVFAKNFNFMSIGLRYFNIFGPRQDPKGAYAAVIPIWIDSMLNDKEIYINGSGETSRDFTFVENAVQANILSSLADKDQKNQIYNVACGSRITLLEMFSILKSSIEGKGKNYSLDPIFRDFRKGDVMHSEADISKAKKSLGYCPSHYFDDGIKETIDWYINNKTK